MALARAFVIISLLAVISSASASLLAPHSSAGPDQPPPKPERYYGPSAFA
ncbi:hypothetical protein ABLE91_26660 [Aquabacter sp. CN5-332]